MSPGAASCPLCNGVLDSAPLWSTTDYLGVAKGVFRFHRCLSCASAVLNPMPDQDYLNTAYPPGYLFRPDGGRGLKAKLKRLEWMLFHRARFRRAGKLVRKLPLPSNARILDVGCGEGYRAAFLRDSGYVVEGQEMPSSAAAASWRKLGLTVHEGALEEHVVRLKGAYDAVVLYSVLEHLPEAGKTIGAIRAVLRHPGWLLLQVPLVDGLTARMFGSRHSFVREAPRHVFLPSRKGLAALIRSCGFEVSDIQPAYLGARAGVTGLSLVSGGAYHNAARRSPLAYMLSRGLVSAAAIVAGLPLGLIEQAIGNPSMVILTARTRSPAVTD